MSIAFKAGKQGRLAAKYQGCETGVRERLRQAFNGCGQVLLASLRDSSHIISLSSDHVLTQESFEMAEKTRLIPAIAAKRSRSLRSALVLNIVFCLLSLYLIKHAYESTKLSKDPHQRALRLMRDHPLIDGHVRITLLVLMQVLNSADRLMFQSIFVTRELLASILYGL